MMSIRTLNLLAMTALAVMGAVGVFSIHRLVATDLGSGLLTWTEDGAFLSLAYGACLVLGAAGLSGAIYWTFRRH